MLLRDFYRIISTEESTCSFLRQNNLLDQSNGVNCHRCGTPMRDARKRDRGGEFRSIFRCPRKGCQTSRSVRQGNEFFHFSDLNGRCNSRLQLWEILEIVFMFVTDIPIVSVCSLTSKSSATVTDWYNMCRKVCTSMCSVATKGQMTGTSTDPIQIDEARFAGRRKYNRGRLLLGDQHPESEESDASVENHRNHGARVDGPWVFGLKKGNDLRYFYVQRRDRATLLPIIQRQCTHGSHIHSDEWPAYSTLKTLGYIHTTVNHQQHYIDPATGAHTQAIERSWLDSKIKILKKMRGTTPEMLQSHLNEFCWRVQNKDSPDLFVQFLRDIANVYR